MPENGSYVYCAHLPDAMVRAAYLAGNVETGDLDDLIHAAVFGLSAWAPFALYQLHIAPRWHDLLQPHMIVHERPRVLFGVQRPSATESFRRPPHHDGVLAVVGVTTALSASHRPQPQPPGQDKE